MYEASGWGAQVTRPHPEKSMKVRWKSNNTKGRGTQVRQELGLRDRKQGFEKKTLWYKRYHKDKGKLRKRGQVLINWRSIYDRYKSSVRRKMTKLAFIKDKVF